MMAQLGVTRIKISQVGLHFDMLKLNRKDSVARKKSPKGRENPFMSPESKDSSLVYILT